MDEHERDGRVAQRPRQMAEMTGGVRLRALGPRRRRPCSLSRKISSSSLPRESGEKW
jgi:hypothetical protein